MIAKIRVLTRRLALPGKDDKPSTDEHKTASKSTIEISNNTDAQISSTKERILYNKDPC
jgi:hypothetical protein